MCACDVDRLCPRCAEAEADEWEPEPQDEREPRPWLEAERALGLVGS